MASLAWPRDTLLALSETPYVLNVSCPELFIHPARQCVRAYVYESKVFVSMVLILIFGEVLGLYGYAKVSSVCPRRLLIQFTD